jgi:peroxiredoxin
MMMSIGNQKEVMCVQSGMSVKKSVFLIWLAIHCQMSAAQHPDIKPLTRIDQAVSKNFTVRDTAGSVIQLSQIIPDKGVTAINFWATWCAPCRKEIPHLVDEYTQHKDNGLHVIGLCTEPYDTSREKVITFIRKNNINYPVYFSSREVYHFFNSTEQGQPIYLPRLLLFDQQGRLTHQFDKWYGVRSKKEQSHAINSLLKQLH